MKRENLKIFVGKCVYGIGEVSEFGLVNNGKVGKDLSVLIKNVTIRNFESVEYVDHLWFKYNKKIAGIDLHKGDIIFFSCVVKEYFFDDKSKKKSKGFTIRGIHDIYHLKRGKGHSVYTLINESKTFETPLKDFLYKKKGYVPSFLIPIDSEQLSYRCEMKMTFDKEKSFWKTRIELPHVCLFSQHDNQISSVFHLVKEKDKYKYKEHFFVEEKFFSRIKNKTDKSKSIDERLMYYMILKNVRK